MTREPNNLRNRKLQLCSGCIREKNRPLYVKYFPKFSTQKEAIEFAQKCPSGKCIYDLKIKRGTMKHLLGLILMTISLSSCLTWGEPKHEFDKMEPPIIVVAESPKGAVTLCDAQGTYVTFGDNYYLAQTISASYNKGDTLKFLKGKEKK